MAANDAKHEKRFEEMADLAKKAVAAAQTAPTATVADSVAVANVVTESQPVTGKLFGNLDKAKQFPLDKLLPSVEELPDDKFVVVIQKHNILTDGTPSEDKTARRAQVIDAGTYKQNTTPDKNSGEKIYDVLFGKPGSGGGFVTVHEPVS